MNAMRRVLMLLALIALAGCGSSGGGANTRVGTGSTGSGTATSFNPKHVPKSAPISSTAYYNTLVRAFSTSGALTSPQAKAAARCIQTGLLAAGFKTQGDTEGANSARALAIGGKCIQQAKGQ